MALCQKLQKIQNRAARIITKSDYDIRSTDILGDLGWENLESRKASSPLGLKWRKSVKALGIHFSYDTVEMTQKNFFEKLKSIQEQIQIWKWRGLSLYGKVTIVKTLLIPKFIYVASVLCTPNEFVRKLKEIDYRFLWNGPDKVARAATINSINFGGLNMTDFEISIKSFRLAWIGRYLNENSAPWKSFFQYQLKNYGGTIFLKCNYNIKD